VVKPHEKIFRGVVTDRLRLLDACRTQFSQVFSVYPDENDVVMATLEAAKEQEPLSQCDDSDGCRHTLWQVKDKAAIARARELFSDKSLYIADGHHRYTTALQMREKMAERSGNGSVAADSPFNFMMMYLCAIEDPGLSVLPTHRLVRLQEISRIQDSFQITKSLLIRKVKKQTKFQEMFCLLRLGGRVIQKL